MRPDSAAADASVSPDNAAADASHPSDAPDLAAASAASDASVLSYLTCPPSALCLQAAGLPAEEWRPFDQMYEVSASGGCATGSASDRSSRSFPGPATLIGTFA